MSRRLSNKFYLLVSGVLSLIMLLLGKFILSAILIITAISFVWSGKVGRYKFIRILFLTVLVFSGCEILVDGLSLDLQAIRPFLPYYMTSTPDYDVCSAPINDDREFPQEVSHYDPDLGYIHLRSQKPPEGDFIIAVIGESNTYGSEVSSLEDTYPFKLETFLDLQSDGIDYAVMNFGVPGYVIKQKLLLAERLFSHHDVDLLILQDNNRGVSLIQANCMKAIKHHFSAFPNSHHEYFISPLRVIPELRHTLWSELSESVDTHLSGSAAFRFINAMSLRLLQLYDPATLQRVVHQIRNSDGSEEAAFVSEFVSRHDDVPLVIFAPPPTQSEHFVSQIQADSSKKHLIKLDASNLSEEYGLIHPPAYVYEWYAEEIADYLIANNLVPIG